MNPIRLTLLASLALILTACQVRSPILLEPKTMAQAARQIPVKAGVKIDLAQPGQQLSNIWTMSLPIPFVTTKAAFPKLVEKDYFSDAVMMNLKAHGPFAYCYQSPFDEKDVDVILNFHIKKYVLDNNRGYSHGVQIAGFVSGMVIPLGQLIVAFGLPQEKFSLEQNLSVDVMKPSGEVIKTYDLGAIKDGESVWLTQQPYANYMWYNSVYIRNLNVVMKKLMENLDGDAQLIAATAKK